MKIILSTLKKILFWSYERGSWQYDVMCVLILAFIFLWPNNTFRNLNTSAPLVIGGVGIARIDPNDVGAFEERPHPIGHAVRVSHIEKGEVSSGAISYLSWRKTFGEAVQFAEKQHEAK